MTPGAGLFWPQGYYLNRLGRSPLGDATYQISRLWALWFQTRRFFHVLTFIGLWKNMWPLAGSAVAQWKSSWLETEGRRVQASLRCGPWARHIYPSFVLVHPRKTRPCLTERLSMGPKESNQTNKHVTPGAGPFWPQWHKLNKLGRGPLGDATYQVSRL